MAVIRVLYLPRDERLRTVVRTALDFVEEVYRDEVLLDLKFVSFDPGDSFDEEQAKYVADREGFGVVFEFNPTLFWWPHQSGAYVWMPVSRKATTSSVFYVVAHETTHYAFRRLPLRDRMDLVVALWSDVGTEVDEIVKRHGLQLRLAKEMVKEFAMIVNETVTAYILDNYFVSLNREPKILTFLTDIRIFAESRYNYITSRPPKPKHLAEVLSIIYNKMAYDDLPNYRRAIHETFMKLVKKLPVDVLESNRTKYGILYREEPIA
jgi:hypothetical protein